MALVEIPDELFAELSDMAGSDGVSPALALVLLVAEEKKRRKADHERVLARRAAAADRQRRSRLSRDVTDVTRDKRDMSPPPSPPVPLSFPSPTPPSNPNSFPPPPPSPGEIYSPPDAEVPFTEGEPHQDFDPPQDAIPGAKKRYPEWFEEFWRAGPWRAGKFPAFEVARKLPLSDRAKLLDGLARWKVSERWAAGYVVEAKRWFRERRFEDYPEPRSGAAGAIRAAPGDDTDDVIARFLARHGAGEVDDEGEVIDVDADRVG